MEFLEEKYSACCCTAGDFATVSGRDDHGDNERAVFCLDATLFQKTRRVQRQVQGQEPTVAFYLRTAVQRLNRGAISADRMHKHPLKAMRSRPFSFKEVIETMGFSFVPGYFNLTTSLSKKIPLGFHRPKGGRWGGTSFCLRGQV